MLVKLARLSNFRTLVTEPNFNLIQPGTVLGGEVKHNLMAGVPQEVCSSLHGLENARFTFDSQVNFKTFRKAPQTEPTIPTDGCLDNPSPSAIWSH